MTTVDDDKHVDQVTGIATTGHDWDGVRELNEPLPRWWLWTFYTALLAVLTQAPLRQRWRWGVAAGLGWLCVGLVGCFLVIVLGMNRSRRQHEQREAKHQQQAENGKGGWVLASGTNFHG